MFMNFPVNIDNSCDHTRMTRATLNESAFSRYLKEGAALLANRVSQSVRTASREGLVDMYDARYWEKSGRWYRNSQVHILATKPSTLPSTAVHMIFREPQHWRLDCSQFSQVIMWYAWLKILGSAKFDCRVANASGKIQLRPFQGAVFTKRRRCFWRDSKWARMKYFEYPKGSGVWALQSPLTVDEIIAAAPVGSRIGFKNDRGSDNFVNEQTVKAGPDQFLAHGLSTVALSRDEVITNLYAQGRNRSSHPSLTEAKRHVWVKDVAIFVSDS